MGCLKVREDDGSMGTLNPEPRGTGRDRDPDPKACTFLVRLLFSSLASSGMNMIATSKVAGLQWLHLEYVYVKTGIQFSVTL